MSSAKLSVYLQIVEDVKRKIESGLLREGDRLSSCRELALELGINPNTVQRAYSALEEEGYIYTVPKKGVYVAQKTVAADIGAIAAGKLCELKNAGLSKDEILKLLNEIYGDDYD